MMRLITAAAAVVAVLTLGGCGVSVDFPPARTAGEQPALAAWFDCVREQGGAVLSAHRATLTDGADAENTLQSIRATGRAIPNAIVEIDIARTRDGRLVLMHDETLERTTTGQGRVADLSFDQVRRAVVERGDGGSTGEPVPTLAEALAAADEAGVIASLDLKPAPGSAGVDLARQVIAEVRRVGAQDRVILITYSAGDARAVGAMAPEMMLSAGMSDVAGLDGLAPAQLLAWTGAREPKPELWAALGARGVEAQFGTLGPEGRRSDDRYAMDGDLSEYRELVEQGVTVIATDRALAASRVLGDELAATGRCRR